MDGLVDGIGGWMYAPSEGSSIFLIFKYVKKLNALIGNMPLKIGRDFSIKIHELFKISKFRKLRRTNNENGKILIMQKKASQPSGISKIFPSEKIRFRGKEA